MQFSEDRLNKVLRRYVNLSILFRLKIMKKDGILSMINKLKFWYK
jgi:hypothetical protein